MSPLDAETSKPSLPPRTSGIKTVLKYTGIPPSWLDKRPKLPSRNWLIFLSVTSSIAGYYVYDRRECKRIRQEYIDKVKTLSEEPIGPIDLPRKVVVYGGKWPGDEEYQQAMKYFRKYVKPVLVAAAVDFDMITGKRLGSIAKRVAEDTRLRRRRDLGIDDDPEAKKAIPTYKPLSEVRRGELEGGVVIIGRPTFKEYMAGLHKGWSEGLEKVDDEEVLARILDEDHHFDEVDDDQPAPVAAVPHSPVFSMASLTTPKPQSQPEIPASASSVPTDIPQLPPILLVPFCNRIGLSQIPMMIWDWFNQRERVKSGAEAGYRLVMNYTRPIEAPIAPYSFDQSSPEQPSQGDLAFDRQAEDLFKRSLSKIPDEIEKSRKEYYDKVGARLATARALARGTREPTKEEMEAPPPTEVELRAERMKKEMKWRNDLDGWNLVKASTPIVWDERFRDALRIFHDPPQN